MPIRPLLNAESGVFGPHELRDIVATFEALLTEPGLTDRSDAATLMLAKLTTELAKKGQFNCRFAARPRPEGNEAHRQSQLGTDARLLHLAFLGSLRSEKGEHT